MAISGRHSWFDRRTLFAEGFAAALFKPVFPSEAVEAVERRLAATEAATEATSVWAGDM